MYAWLFQLRQRPVASVFLIRLSDSMLFTWTLYLYLLLGLYQTGNVRALMDETHASNTWPLPPSPGGRVADPSSLIPPVADIQIILPYDSNHC